MCCRLMPNDLVCFATSTSDTLTEDAISCSQTPFANFLHQLMLCTLVRIAHCHAVDSPVVCLPAGLQTVVCTVLHPRLCAIRMCTASFPGCDISIMRSCQEGFHLAGPLGTTRRCSDARWQMSLTSEVTAVWQQYSCGQIWNSAT